MKIILQTFKTVGTVAVWATKGLLDKSLAALTAGHDFVVSNLTYEVEGREPLNRVDNIVAGSYTGSEKCCPGVPAADKTLLLPVA